MNPLLLVRRIKSLLLVRRIKSLPLVGRIKSLPFVGRIGPLLLVGLVAAAGCTGVSQPVTGPVYDEFGCKVGCDRCAPEAQCISSPYVSACLARCSTALDCGSGEKCVVVAGNEMRSPVCVAPASLVVCHAPDCQLSPMCRDDMTQLKPLPKTFSTCGWELVACDMGCDSATGSCK